MARTAVLGLPRIGAERELKAALEGHWAGKVSEAELEAVARGLRAWNFTRPVDVVPAGDFALYDHVLDVAAAFGIVAPRHRSRGPFAPCRGEDGVAPLEMTKWFDTNYHYLVPEIAPDQRFAPDPSKWAAHLQEGRELGANARPALLGPFSLLLLSKGVDDPLQHLPALTDAYAELIGALDAPEVQLDEPCLVQDRTEAQLDAFAAAYAKLPNVALATYFGGLDAPTLTRIAGLPLRELHVDLIRAPEQLDAVLEALPPTIRLSAGVVDGRNVWACDIDAALALLDRAASQIGSDRLTIAPSCSLLHVPYSAARETGLDGELRSWLAFGEEKLAELELLKRAVDAGDRDELLAPARARAASRRRSARTYDAAVRARTAALRPDDYERSAPLADRRAVQLDLPELPTTTIGSFPQTKEIRAARRLHRAGELGDAAYERFLEDQIETVVREQEALDLDVLVHGEPERNDMVEYFGERLLGFAFTRAGWVQSYGSRCVKPPILYGDVARPAPMTVRWWRHAQSLTERPVKGMLTGPVTILQWSFVRDDQPRAETCTQIALAIADEVADLEAAGAAVIQVDEAALREGLPLRAAEQDAYLRWAIDAFRLTVANARPETQIHTHMCYSEFGSMIEHIARLDADVLSVEASRSGMELLDDLRGYPGQVGPGVYDIHSPRVPSEAEVDRLLALAEERVPRAQLWVNPDCGLKTRGWEETRAALANLVAAAHRRRAAVPA